MCTVTVALQLYYGQEHERGVPTLNEGLGIEYSTNNTETKLHHQHVSKMLCTVLGHLQAIRHRLQSLDRNWSTPL